MIDPIPSDELRAFRAKRHLSGLDFVVALEADFGRPLDPDSRVFLLNHPITVNLVNGMLNHGLRKGIDEKDVLIYEALVLDLTSYPLKRIPDTYRLIDVVPVFSESYPDAGNVLLQALDCYASLKSAGLDCAVDLLTMEDANPLVVVVSRENVEQCDITPTVAVLARLLESVSVIRSFEERVDIAFHGYDSHPAELCELVEVRAFVQKLDEQFPYWLYFLTKEGTGLQALALCFLPPFLTEDGKRSHWPERLRALLDRRWFPALGELCTRVGLDESATQQRMAAAVHYFVEGPRRPFDPTAMSR